MRTSKLFLMTVFIVSAFSGLHADAEQKLNQHSVEIVAQNEQDLANAVMLTVLALADRQAVYAKQAILLEREAVFTIDQDKKNCVKDTGNFFKTLVVAQDEAQIRLIHHLFADRYAQCQKTMLSGKSIHTESK